MKQGDKGWGENLSYTFSLHDWSYKLLSSRIKQLRDVEKCLQRWAITCKNSCFTPKRYEQTSISDVYPGYPLLLLVVQNFFWHFVLWCSLVTPQRSNQSSLSLNAQHPWSVSWKDSKSLVFSETSTCTRIQGCNMQMGWRIRLPVPNKVNEWRNERMNERTNEWTNERMNE